MQRSSPVGGVGLLIAAHHKAQPGFYRLRRSKTELSLRPKMHFFVAQAKKTCLFVAQPCAMQGYLSSHSPERRFHWENRPWNSIPECCFCD